MGGRTRQETSSLDFESRPPCACTVIISSRRQHRPSGKNKNKQVSSQPSPRRSGFWIAKNRSFTLQPASLGYLRLSLNPSSQVFCRPAWRTLNFRKKAEKWRETCESLSKATPPLPPSRPPPPSPRPSNPYPPPTFSFIRRSKWLAQQKNQQFANLGFG